MQFLSNTHPLALLLGGCVVGALAHRYIYTEPDDEKPFTSWRPRKMSLDSKADASVSQLRMSASTPARRKRSMTEVVTEAPIRHPIFRVAVTGGPCSGKSTCMEQLAIALKNAGFRPYIVPETATLMINGGLEFSQMTNEKLMSQQRVILQTILALEDAFYETAKTANQPCVLLCDRGTMDGRAYCSKEQFDTILQRSNYTIEELRDARYDAVIHLVTAAKGAEEFYTLENNAARRETAEEARDLDANTLKQWIGHRSLHVIDNSTGFEQKVKRTVATILNLVGADQGSVVTRRFRVELPTLPLPVECEESTVSLFKLSSTTTNGTADHRSKDAKESLVIRSSAANTMYFHQVEDSTGFVYNVKISHRAFEALLRRQAPNSETVVKRNVSFFWEGKYYQLKVFLEPANWKNVSVLCAAGDVDVSDLPPFICVLDEVTNNREFKSATLSEKPAGSPLLSCDI